MQKISRVRDACRTHKIHKMCYNMFFIAIVFCSLLDNIWRKTSFPLHCVAVCVLIHLLAMHVILWEMVVMRNYFGLEGLVPGHCFYLDCYRYP